MRWRLRLRNGLRRRLILFAGRRVVAATPLGRVRMAATLASGVGIMTCITLRQCGASVYERLKVAPWLGARLRQMMAETVEA